MLIGAKRLVGALVEALAAEGPEVRVPRDVAVDILALLKVAEKYDERQLARERGRRSQPGEGGI